MNYESGTGTESSLGTIRGDYRSGTTGTQTPGVDAARAASETTERVLSGEPSNSTIRATLLAGAGLSILASLALQFSGRKNEALFVGQWPPTLVAIALWYQIVKSERGGPASTQGRAGY